MLTPALEDEPVHHPQGQRRRDDQNLVSHSVTAGGLKYGYGEGLGEMGEELRKWVKSGGRCEKR